MKVRVHILPKPEIPDLPGQTVEASLRELGFYDVRSVKLGRIVELDLASGDELIAKDQIRRMCEELLAHPSLESWEIDIIENSGLFIF